ncbi:MAG: hypothetical protein P8176_16605 [Gammaproteobacteria bacterium]
MRQPPFSENGVMEVSVASIEAKRKPVYSQNLNTTCRTELLVKAQDGLSVQQMVTHIPDIRRDMRHK